ncbi:DUF4157 domain-containing protein [Chitinophaga sp. GCM10012297]|uniref:DUF4157 domain-containing protein n=1 Tax=Chitinophaga chungangae TaxID=2821488 RepID=A0ABS3YIB6_9BACT|nr:DUF4157 domain-containing protein [Chitinophaga chungangae]MBO9154438.1 DUF4157 domain-containing protein [Chitinophaga chungangae]
MRTEPQRSSSTVIHARSFFGRSSQAGPDVSSQQAPPPFFSPHTIQPALEIGAAGDPYEQEADAMADKVVRRMIHPGPPVTPAAEQAADEEIVQEKEAAPPFQLKCATYDHGETMLQEKPSPPPVQLKCAACEHEESLQRKEENDENAEADRRLTYDDDPTPVPFGSIQRKCAACEEKEKLQRHPDTSGHDTATASPSLESRLATSGGSGQALPDSLRQSMESGFNADFSGVKVHTDGQAAQMNRELGAKAFTHRNDIYFNTGSYSPGSLPGQKLIAHELTHVIQQTGNKVQRKKHSVQKNMVQLAPNVTAVNAPAEMPANQGSRVRLTATAARGTAITWSFQGANRGAVLGAGTARNNTVTAPAGSTGGAVTVRAADAANAADFADTVINLVEIRQPTFTFLPPMPAFAPPRTMDASVCNNTATAAVITAPALRPVTWSIRGNARGAVINAATGVVTPSARQTGQITIRATDNALPAAFNQQTLNIQAFPTGIAATTIGTFPIPPAQGGPYGAIYRHSFRSSGGNIANVMITERVACGNGPFGCAGLPVLPGNLNAPAGALQDIIGTPRGIINANNFLPSPPNPGLPQVMNTPQTLYWRSDQCSPAPAAPPAAAPGDHWVPFVNVPITATLSRAGGALRFQTVDNGLATLPEPYTGAPLAAAPAPAASVCPPGTGVSNVRFAPAPIAADASALTTTAATATVQPPGSAITWSTPGPALGVTIATQGNPGLIRPGGIAGQVRVRAALTATPGCFAEAFLQLREVTANSIVFAPATLARGGATTRATVNMGPSARTVNWAIIGNARGCVIARNADNSATITSAAQVGRITVRATDQRDATKFTETSLVIA